MRTLGLVVVALTGLGLSGCSQISSIWKKSDTVASTAHTDHSLRTTPQQTYAFANQSYNVDVHSQPSPFAGYAVELYNTRSSYVAPAFSDPRDTEFVNLNDESDPIDWQNCERLHRGYLHISEHDFGLDPEFEVCMRNKGYVLTTESGPTSKQVLNAQSAGLRQSYQPSTITYSYPETSQPSATTSGYPGYFQ